MNLRVAPISDPPWIPFASVLGHHRVVSPETRVVRQVKSAIWERLPTTIPNPNGAEAMELRNVMDLVTHREEVAIAGLNGALRVFPLLTVLPDGASDLRAIRAAIRGRRPLPWGRIEEGLQ